MYHIRKAWLGGSRFPFLFLGATNRLFSGQAFRNKHDNVAVLGNLITGMFSLHASTCLKPDRLSDRLIA